MPRIAPFERYADEYDRWFERNRDLYLAELALLRSFIPSKGLRGLEVGVGSGMFSLPLGIRLGVEPCLEMARRAMDRGIQVMGGIAEELPVRSQAFDLVLMVTTICFVDDVLMSFKEAKRVLKPSGIFLVGFVDKESELGKRYQEMREKSRFYKDATFYSARKVLGLLERAGFKGLIARQTLIPGKPKDEIEEGFGKGSFVGIKGIK